jgi:hypothetical protein
VRKLLLAIALMIVGLSTAVAQCPDRSSIRWSLLPAQNSAQPIFVPTTSTRSIYRLCIDAELQRKRRHYAPPAADPSGLEVRIACGANGAALDPPCTAVSNLQPGSCFDIKTEGTIWLFRVTGEAKAAAEGAACRITSR